MRGQLDLDGHETASLSDPAAVCAQETLFSMPPGIRGQMALEAPAELTRAQLRAHACPTCRAKPGSPCKRPSGHTVFGGDVHAARRDLARPAGT